MRNEPPVDRPRPCAFVAPYISLLLLTATPSIGSEDDGTRPFFRARQDRVQTAGPRTQPIVPESVDEVRIGYFGPADPDHPIGGGMWRAAQMAVEQANADGGYRGKPFRLIPAWSENPWGTGTAELARLVYRERVWAIVGGIDGPSTHLAEQVVAKAGLTLVSPVSTDKTVNLAGVSWMLSLAPDDHRAAAPLAEEIELNEAAGDLMILSADDHDSRLFTAELRKALAQREVTVSRQIEFRRGARPAEAIARQVIDIGPALVAVSADPGDSARMAVALGEAGYNGRLFGGPAIGHREFLVRAGNAAEGLAFPLLYDAREDPFRAAYRRKHGRGPDYTAAHTYDAVTILVEAIGAAGLDRRAIRDALPATSSWTGATGPIEFDRLGSNTREVSLGVVRGGARTQLRPTVESIPGDRRAR